MKAGFLVIDKAAGMTSHDVVGVVRAITGLKKVGHTGTLDPFATGVLVLALGGATRFIQYLDESLKVYDAVIQLGESTETGDPEGDILETASVPPLKNVEEVLRSLEGKQMQRPPAYSAVKFKGKPLYKYARAGEAVEVPARPIEIYKMTLIEQGEDWLRVEIRCSRGTYARVIANDVAEALGTVGHLRELRRSQSGDFQLDESVDMPGLAQIAAGRDDHAVVFSKQGERVKWFPREDVFAELMRRTRSLSEAFPTLLRVQCNEGEKKRLLAGGAAPNPPMGTKPGERYLAMEGEEVLAILESKGRTGQALRVLDGKPRRR
ncbi:MAG: tRNA pseudouridine(55) synthase TruB [Myxococcota bacterium]|nr:tRNA pseudouridine(55) synthase TruB [Myxococcota bacterium]